MINTKFLYLIVTIMVFSTLSCNKPVTSSTDGAANADTIIKCHTIREGKVITSKLYYLFDKKNDRHSKLSCYCDYQTDKIWRIRFCMDDKECLLATDMNRDSAVVALSDMFTSGFALTYHEQIQWVGCMMKLLAQENDLSEASFADTFLSEWGDECIVVSQKYDSKFRTDDIVSFETIVKQSNLIKDLSKIFGIYHLNVKEIYVDGLSETTYNTVTNNSLITIYPNTIPQHIMNTRIHLSFK